MPFDLAFIWAGLIAIAILAYVILDGFDLGIGILFPFLKSASHRDQAMNTVAPVWDGNETWLGLGGGGLFAVFPLAYAVILSVLYAPIIAMLIGLIFSLNAKKDNVPFTLTLGLFLASYCGLGISIYPYMVPPSITIWQAAAPDESLMFLLVGAVVLLPIIIGYTAYSYWVFRGKTRSGEGYQ